MIIKDSSYIGSKDAIVDKDEFNETRDNIEYIKNDAQQYINDYVDYLMGKTRNHDKKKFERIYGYSTLQYFHNELGITISKDIEKQNQSKVYLIGSLIGFDFRYPRVSVK